MKHTGTGKHYAVKEVSKGTLMETRMTTNAILEKEILSECESPFIIKLYNTYKDAEHLYYVLEACLCSDLHEFLQKHNLHGELKCVQYYSGVAAEALLYLHKKHVIYRDLKLNNLLVKEDGTCKLCDMNKAKSTKGKTGKTCIRLKIRSTRIIDISVLLL